VFLRLTDGGSGGADVIESSQIGVLGEAGSQWGLSVGWVDRIAASPLAGIDDPDAPGVAGAGWQRWLGTMGDLSPGKWHFSPVWTRGRDLPPREFLYRRTIGAQAVAGPEATSVSIGVIVRTLLLPRRDAVTALRFDSSRPFATRLLVWPASSGTLLPAGPILEEVSQQ
jgi:hypothetical protein